ncbi:MAG: hypothetical protein IT518_09815 [Burkholderiales bacterium]|nr:hypothetical protein [Burkholderiales bacterium]
MSSSIPSISVDGLYVGCVVDDAGVAWQIFIGEECKDGMAVELIAVRADVPRLQWRAELWLHNLRILSFDSGWDPSVGRGAQFFDRLQAHLADVIRDGVLMGTASFLAPAANTSEACH